MKVSGWVLKRELIWEGARERHSGRSSSDHTVLWESDRLLGNWNMRVAALERAQLTLF